MGLYDVLFVFYLLWLTEIDLKIKQLLKMDPCCRSTRHRGGETETFRGQLDNTEAGDSV